MKKLALAFFVLLSSLQAFGRSTPAAFKVTDIHRALTQNSDWLNTSRALKAEDLRGRIILLDFWTYCCINCIHVMPDLKALEDEFGSKLTVIGVHSAKFNNEKDTENIRNAILRYDLRHPVVNDSSFTLWDGFGVHSWPTFILISPDGTVAEAFTGEGNRERVAASIKELIAKYGARINTSSLPIKLEKDKTPPHVLYFPGKLIFVSQFRGGPALFVSDSSHHRVVAMNLHGQIILNVGKKGEVGDKIGTFEEARFNKPQGLLFEKDSLFIADTGNHELKRADLTTGRVEVLAGTGQQGQSREPQAAPALQTGLNSPWDLAFFPDAQHIVVAMAGSHQLWSYDRGSKTLSVIAGNGSENLVDGKYPDNSLAQPSGLSALDKALYFVDSETSSLRRLEKGEVTTLIGSGLFDFGFRDGKKGEALLQHPIGLAARRDFVYVADSYNHSIRRFDLKKKILETFAGTNERGLKDGKLTEARFNEPNGITFAADSDVAYVTDTNNDAVRVIDLKLGTVKTLNVTESKSQINRRPSEKLPNLIHDPVVVVKAETPVELKLALDPGWHINEQAPTDIVLFDVTRRTPQVVAEFDRDTVVKGVNLKIPALDAHKKYRLQGTYYYCEIKAGSVCKIQSHDQAVEAGQGGATSMAVKISSKE